MADFDAHPMRGTSFDIGDDDEEPLTRINSPKSMRPLNEISDMIEQITQRMKYYQDKYRIAKKSNNREVMITSLRNYKALEGSRKSLRWVLRDNRAQHPLF